MRRRILDNVCAHSSGSGCATQTPINEGGGLEDSHASCAIGDIGLVVQNCRGKDGKQRRRIFLKYCLLTPGPLWFSGSLRVFASFFLSRSAAPVVPFAAMSRGDQLRQLPAQLASLASVEDTVAQDISTSFDAVPVRTVPVPAQSSRPRWRTRSRSRSPAPLPKRVLVCTGTTRTCSCSRHVHAERPRPAQLRRSPSILTPLRIVDAIERHAGDACAKKAKRSVWREI